MEKVVFTIVARNYLPYARNLMDSVAEHESGSARYIFVADMEGPGDTVDPGSMYPGSAPSSQLEGTARSTIVVGAASLPVPCLRDMAFYYDVVEYCTAIKPHCIEWLFDSGFRRAMYIDPDMMCFGPLESAWAALDSASALLVPHVLGDAPGALLDDLSYLNNGTFNLGFFTVKDGTEGRAILDWWKRKLSRECFLDYGLGLATDQKWANLMPALFPGVSVFRDPSYDVAFWNVHERPVTEENGVWKIRGQQALTLFHFSGYSLSRPEYVTRGLHLRLDATGALERLFSLYRERVEERGIAESVVLPYGFGSFSNGTPVLPIHRRTYFSLLAKGFSFGDPFGSEGNGTLLSFFRKMGIAPHKTSPRRVDPRLGSGVAAAAGTGASTGVLAGVPVGKQADISGLISLVCVCVFRLLGPERSFRAAKGINWLTRPSVLASILASRRRSHS